MSLLPAFLDLTDIITRQHCQVVRVPHLKSGDPAFKSHSDNQLDLFQIALGSIPAALAHSRLGSLLPVGILTLLSLFQ